MGPYDERRARAGEEKSLALTRSLFRCFRSLPQIESLEQTKFFWISVDKSDHIFPAKVTLQVQALSTGKFILVLDMVEFYTHATCSPGFNLRTFLVDVLD